MKHSISAYKLRLNILPIAISATIWFLAGCVGSNNKEGVIISDKSVMAIPTDASAIIIFNDIGEIGHAINPGNTLLGNLFFGNSNLGSFIIKAGNSFESENDGKDKSSSTISFHYSARDKVSLLFSVRLSADMQRELKRTLKESRNQSRDFNGVTIERAGAVEYAFTGDYLVASDSPLIIESSIRHILTGSSVADDDAVKTLLNTINKPLPVLFINHSQTGKLFSGYVERKFLAHSDFFSKFGTWSYFNVGIFKNSITLNGTTYNNRGAASFCEVISGIRGEQGNTIGRLPSDTYSLLTLSVKEIDAFAGKFSLYKDMQRGNPGIREPETLSWLKGMNAREVSIAYIPVEGKSEQLLIIERKRTFANRIKGLFSKSNEGNIREFKKELNLNRVFGDAFRVKNADLLYEVDNFVFIGDSAVISRIEELDAGFSCLEKKIGETEAHNLLKKDGNALTILVNAGERADSLVRYFRDKKELKSVLKSYNIIIGGVQVSAGKKGELLLNLFLYADMHTTLPNEPVE